MEGVRTIAAPGAPGIVMAFGAQAVPLVAGKADGDMYAPVAVAAPLGRGRIVALGHTSYLTSGVLKSGDTARFLQNSIRWALGVTGPFAGARLRVALLSGDLESWLREQGFDVTRIEHVPTDGSLSHYHALIGYTSGMNAAEADAVAKFVDGGGGLVAAETGWGWMQLHPGKRITDDLPGNRILAPAGLLWTDGTLGRTSPDGFSTGRANFSMDTLNADAAFDALSILDQSSKQQELSSRARESGAAKLPAQPVWTITHAARYLPKSDALLRPRLLAELKKRAPGLVPTAAAPLKADAGMDRVLLAVQLADATDLPPAEVKAHRAADEFPGRPEHAKPVTGEIAVDEHVPGWHSTGLYADAGARISITIPKDSIDRKLRVRIGAHTDELWHADVWKRVPSISRDWPLDGERTEVASEFGGLIYVEAPDQKQPRTIDVQIDGGVEAPRFVRGKTSVDEWKARIRNLPGPWAELETAKVIVTVPSKEIRALDDPEAVLELWDRVLDAAADLAGRPRDRQRPERYVADVQISAGYMHSGYPIMTHLDAAPAMVSREKLLAGQWGLFHELGHNHQSGDWTFDGTGEVTCNLFSLYICETVCGLPQRAGHDALPKLDEGMKKYVAAGAKFEQWKRDPFLALTMYVQLREAFGWDAFKHVFAEYRDLDRAARPKSDAEKRDQWLVRMSKTVGRDLGPFFSAWGVPTSEAARKEIAGLPKWMPENFAPAK